MNMQTWLPSGLGIKILLVEFSTRREESPYLSFQVLLHPVRTSLVQSLQERLSHQVDVLIFNPPYVPTDELEATSGQEAQDISGAWAGGADGMYLTNVLLKQVDVRNLSLMTLPSPSFVPFPPSLSPRPPQNPREYRMAGWF